MKSLKLKDLKIKSFVTSIDKDIVDTVKGGINTSVQQRICDSSPQNCQDLTNQCGSNNCETTPYSCIPSGGQRICDTSVNCF